MIAQQTPKVRCGDCEFFVRNGKCRFFETPEGSAKDRPFATAPFWVWSDCYSDKELVRDDVETACSTFRTKITGAAS